MDEGKCRRSTGIKFGTFIVFDTINDLPNGLQSNPKLFADDTSLFSTIRHITSSTVSIIHDLWKTSEWVIQWKMNFNPDPCKQAKKLLFSQEISLHFNDNPVHQVQPQKHLGLFLDSKLSLTHSKHLK